MASTSTATRLGLRFIDGLAEPVYRELLPGGLTARDPIDEATLGARPSMAHVTAREEVQALLAVLRLPADEGGRRRAATCTRNGSPTPTGRSRRTIVAPTDGSWWQPRIECDAVIRDHSFRRLRRALLTCAARDTIIGSIPGRSPARG